MLYPRFPWAVSNKASSRVRSEGSIESLSGGTSISTTGTPQLADHRADDRPFPGRSGWPRGSAK